MIKYLWHKIPERVRRKLLKPKFYFDYKRQFKKFSQNVNLDNPPVFKSIEIETLNRCNGRCAFCPVNVHQKQREYAKMDDKLFHKIIEELKEINYTGAMSLYSNNEPFLDERIPAFLKYAKENIPAAYHRIYTNGSMLTPQLLENVMRYLDEMVIDNYSDSGLYDDKMRDLLDYVKHNDFGGKIRVENRIWDEILTSRGGQAPNKKRTKGITNGCFLPFEQMVIRPTGEVSLCCNDALGIYTLGNVNEQSVIEVWQSQKYRKIREEMILNNRKNLKLCNECDTQIRM